MHPGFALLMLVSGSASLADPIAPGPLLAAASWTQATLVGTMATLVAVIAVAAIGAMMLTGRVDLRRGLMVVLGCFVLFGASSIAAGIRSAISASDGAAPPPVMASSSPPAPVLPPRPKPAHYDPYAGASMPPPN